MKLFNYRQELLQISVLVFLVAVSGRILMHGFAEYYLQDVFDGNNSSIDSVLSWYENHSKGAYLKAKILEEVQPEKAEALLHQAIFTNPTDARPLTVLARIIAPVNKGIADELVTLASSKMPANKSVHLRAANYWIERQQLDKALDAWHMALSVNAGLGQQIFPVLFRVLKNEEIQRYLLPFALNPPPWWESFVTYTVKNAQDISIVSRLHQLRNQSEVPLSDKERIMLVNRYIKDKQWQQAYLVWVEGLSLTQRANLATVYDGSCESVDKSEPFGWQMSSTRYTKTTVRRTIGVDGESALQIKFDKEEMRYHHLYQYLLLPPGDYQFTATKRTEKLAGRGRVKWFIRCSDLTKNIVGESRVILPSIEWEKMQFQFSLPSSSTCSAQTLSLESIGKHAFDHKLSGVMWIDDIHIERIRLQ